MPDFSYTLYSTFTPLIHDPFIVTGTPNTIALCGGANILTYSFNGGGLAAQLMYDPTIREIDIYATNTALLSGSPYTYTVSAELTNFPGYGQASSNG